jgi:hypothetical protein
MLCGATPGIDAFDNQTPNPLSTPRNLPSRTKSPAFHSLEMICPVFVRNDIVLQSKTGSRIELHSGFDCARHRKSAVAFQNRPLPSLENSCTSAKPDPLTHSPHTQRAEHFRVSTQISNEIILQDDAFWIVRRHQLYGPFIYQWSGDLYGLEFTYQGEKFGEVCSEDEFFADLKPFGLPVSVARVAAVTAGSIAVGIRAGSREEDRIAHLLLLLRKFDLHRFHIRSTSEHSGL